ncbi:helix-turn-helix domain-containing protein [Kitasatospora griseola]|uniref:helix-turn-helix domain-containing protein n=1 Tax=Kitasatospora griseola TaxID=2064 RepID=UPI0039956E7B
MHVQPGRGDHEVRRQLPSGLQQCNATRAATRLFTHRNTLLRRLAHADALLPRPSGEPARSGCGPGDPHMAGQGRWGSPQVKLRGSAKGARRRTTTRT